MLKVEIVLIGDLVQINPSVGNVLALLVLEGSLTFLFVLKQDCAFSSPGVICIDSNPD